MRFSLAFDMDNAAFAPDWTVEAEGILHRIARAVGSGEAYVGHSLTIHDSNGNDVGRWKVSDDD